MVQKDHQLCPVGDPGAGRAGRRSWDASRLAAITVESVEYDEVVRLYGPWRSRAPADVAKLMGGYPGRWWIAGGWAIQAFTDVARPHEDIDPSVLRAAANLLRRHLFGHLDVWAADKGTLHPLTGDVVVPPTCSKLWLRASGADPWEYDVVLMDGTEERWTYERDARVTLPFSDILWRRGGMMYLRPEVHLLHKAPGLRPKDQLDFDACLPLLAGPARSWLKTALETAHPGHRWIEVLS